MHLTRRNQLKLMGSVPLGIMPQSAIPSLRDAANRKGLLYGSDSDAGLAATPQAYQDLFFDQCALYAPNLGWRAISPRPGSYDFAQEQPSLDLAFFHHLQITGAHLLWHEQTPGWFLSLPDKARQEQAVVQHATSLCTRFAGHVFAWNVVNEAIMPTDGQPRGLRKTPFPPDLFVLAFQAARAADQRAQLVYNDFGMELTSQEDRRTALLKLLDFLQQRGAPIDAVGLQAHLRIAGFDDFDAEKYRRFLHEIASRNLKIIITELDVMDKGAASDLGARDASVASIYTRFLDAALTEPAVCAVVTWGLSDRYTWLNPTFSRNYARSDGLPTRPLPFDASFQPKPAFFAILNALNNAPTRPKPSR